MLNTTAVWPRKKCGIRVLSSPHTHSTAQYLGTNGMRGSKSKKRVSEKGVSTGKRLVSLEPTVLHKDGKGKHAVIYYDGAPTCSHSHSLLIHPKLTN
jgi:hypothetical protein